MGPCASRGQSAAVGADPSSATATVDNERAVSSKVDVSTSILDERGAGAAVSLFFPRVSRNRFNRLYDAKYGMTYAFVSQRGYYPHQLRKPNQDAWRAGALLLPTFRRGTTAPTPGTSARR